MGLWFGSEIVKKLEGLANDDRVPTEYGYGNAWIHNDTLYSITPIVDGSESRKSWYLVKTFISLSLFLFHPNK